jgi:CTP:molybdopterin cytidylyltransferase MocA
LGDQPLMSPGTIRSLLEAPATPDRPIVVPSYAEDRARNPVLVRRPAFDLVTTTSGDRGLGPLLAAHPERVFAVDVPGANPDVDTPADLERLAAATSRPAEVRA